MELHGKLNSKNSAVEILQEVRSVLAILDRISVKLSISRAVGMAESDHVTNSSGYLQRVCERTSPLFDLRCQRCVVGSFLLEVACFS